MGGGAAFLSQVHELANDGEHRTMGVLVRPFVEQLFKLLCRVQDDDVRPERSKASDATW